MSSPTSSSATDSLFQRLKRVAPWFSGHPSALALGIAGIFIAAGTEPAIPALMKPLLDSGFDRGTLELWKVPVVLLLLFGLRGFAGFIAAYSLARVTNYSMEQLRQRLFEKLLRADPQLFATHHASGLTNTMVYEVNNGASLLVTTMLAFAKDLITLLALLGYLLFLNWKLTLIVFAIFPPIAWVVKNLSRRLHNVVKASQDATEAVAYVVEENVLAYRMVRLHNAQPGQIQKFAQANQKLRQLALKAVVADSVMTPLIQVIAALALSGVITIALSQSTGSQNNVTVGSFAAFITGMLMLISPIKHLSEVTGTLTRGVTALERGLNLMDMAPDENQGTHAVDKTRGEVQFDQVTLQYPSATSPALQGVSLTIQPGQTVALVGASGSGKTTLASIVSEALEIPHLELDSIYHQANWTALPNDSFRRQVASYVEGENWVIDGNYSAVSDLLNARATHVIWLDYPRWFVMLRLFRRTLWRAITSQELWNGNRESAKTWLNPDPKENILVWAWTTHARTRQRYETLFNEQTDTVKIRIGSPLQASRVLNSLGD